MNLSHRRRGSILPLPSAYIQPVSLAERIVLILRSQPPSASATRVKLQSRSLLYIVPENSLQRQLQEVRKERSCTHTLRVAMKSFIDAFFVSLLFSSLAAGVAIPASPATGIILPNNASLADDRDTTHCSSDHASYGSIRRGSVACILALYDLLHQPSITTLSSVYPMDFLSSTAPEPALGNGFRTPWRSTYGESAIQGQHS